MGAYEAVGLIATAVTLYALYMVMVVVLGRTGRTEFNLPAAMAALIANVTLNLLPVPPLGIVGAGHRPGRLLRVVVVALMYGVHPAPLPPGPLYQWVLRLARRPLPTPPRWSRSGRCRCRPAVFAGLLGRLANSACSIPAALFATGFFTDEERGCHSPTSATLASSPRASTHCANAPPRSTAILARLYEAERMDEDIAASRRGPSRPRSLLAFRPCADNGAMFSRIGPTEVAIVAIIALLVLGPQAPAPRLAVGSASMRRVQRRPITGDSEKAAAKSDAKVDRGRRPRALRRVP